MPTQTTPAPTGLVSARGFSKAEQQQIKIAAAKAGVPVYKWAADVIRREIEKQKER